MRRLLPFLIPFITVLTVEGERPFNGNASYHLSNGMNGMVSLNADGYFGSDAITNRLASDYLRHRFITDEHKSDVDAKMSGYNRFGTWFDGSIDVAIRIDSSDLAFISTIQHHLYYDCLFSDDLFSLYFRGNKPFAGERAYVGRSSFQSMLYYQFGAGVSGTAASGKLTWHALGSLYLGHDLLDINSDGDGYLYTAPDGSYIDADVNLRFVRSDSLNTSPLSVNGTGAGISFGGTYDFGKGWKGTLAAANIGFITFNGKTADASIDTSFRFEGIEAQQLFDFKDSVRVFENDSSYIASFFKSRTQAKHTRLVPGHADFSISKELSGGRWILAGGLQWLFSQNATPIFWSTATHPMGSHSLGIWLREGGYSGFNAGLEYGFQSFGWRVSIGSDVLSSWIDTRYGSAMGAFVSLSKSF
ncbi:MAG: DUF5723 family protein [Bacteroidota bacterium]